ncbi:MAG: GGDEF domain-containing protein [Bacteroidia bacterium]|nr:GGDEF domain-containing protein [Bacteroidia bacterium]
MRKMLNRESGFNDITKLNRGRLLFMTYLFLIAFSLYGIVGNAIFTQSWQAVTWFSIMAVVSVFGLIFYVRAKNNLASSIMAISIVIVTYFMLLEISLAAVFILFYFPVVIIISFYLTGRRFGLALTVFVLIITVVYLVVRPGVWGTVLFDGIALANFIVGSITSCGLILLYETALVEAHQRMMQINQKLEVFSVTDALTGLHNRKWIDDELTRKLAQANDGNRFALLVIDFDDFKRINDEFGHIAGDEALRSFAALMKTKVRDDVGRWGGEEFICFYDVASSECALEYAERMRLLVASNDVSPKRKITISIGIALFESGDDAVSLLNRADKSLYEAKARGKNCICCIENGQTKTV